MLFRDTNGTEVYEASETGAPDDEDEASLNKAREELRTSRAEFKEINPEDIARDAAVLRKKIEEHDGKNTLKILEHFDQETSVIALRKWWDRRSPLLQKYLYYMDTLPIFHYLVVVGILELKGSSEAQLQKMEERRLSGNKIAFKILNVLLPEMRAFKPLVEIFEKLASGANELGKESRPYLINKRMAQIETNLLKNTHSRS